MPQAVARARLAHPPRTPRSNDAPYSPERAAQGVHAWLFSRQHALFLQPLRLGARSLEEERRAAVELVERGWVDFGHLEDDDAEADDEEAHDKGKDFFDRRMEAFEEDL